MDNVQFLLQDNGGDDEEQVNDDQVKELVVVVIPSLITTVVAFVLYYILKRRKSLWPVYYSRWELFLQRTQAEGVSVSSSDESRQIEEARPEAAGIDEESAQVSREVEQVFPPVTDEYARPPSVMRMFRLAFFSLAKLVYGPVVLSRQYVHWVYQQRELNEDDPGDQTEIELQDDPRMDYNSERRRPEIGRHVGHITQNRFVQRVLQKARVEANRGIAFPSIGLDGAAMLHFLKFALILSLALLLINLIVLLPTYVTDGEDETGDLDKLSILHVVDDNGRWWAFALAALVVVVLGCIGLRSFWKGYLQLQEVWMARKLQGRDGPVTGQDYEALLSTRVALIRGIPSHLRSEDALRSFLYECVPWAAEQNRVEHIVLLHSHNDIQDKVETVQKSSESVLKKVQKHNQKSDKKLRKGKCTEGELREENNEFQATEVRPLLAELSAQVDELRAAVENERETPDSNTAAVICSDMATATALGHAWLTRDTRMLRMHANVAARDVDWQQVDVAPAENDRQRRSSTILFALVVILWTFPVAFVLSISRLDKLTDTIGFLDFVNDLPSGVRAAIQSLLPAIGLAVLFFILKSVVLMRLARRVSATRHRQYMWAASAYTAFLFVHGFLVFVFSVTIYEALDEIKDNPSSVVDLFASNVPTAWRTMAFFVIVKTAALPMAMLRIGPLLKHIVLSALRKVMKKQNKSEREGPPLPPVIFRLEDNEGKGADWLQLADENNWWLEVPEWLLIFHISLLLAPIAPLILVFSSAYFAVALVVFAVELTHTRKPVLPFAGGTVWLLVALCVTISIFFSLLVWIAVVASRASGVGALLSLIVLGLAGIAVISLGGEMRARFLKATQAMPLDVVARLDRCQRRQRTIMLEEEEKEPEQPRIEGEFERPELPLWRVILRDMSEWQHKYRHYVHDEPAAPQNEVSDSEAHRYDTFD